MHDARTNQSSKGQISSKHLGAVHLGMLEHRLKPRRPSLLLKPILNKLLKMNGAADEKKRVKKIKDTEQRKREKESECVRKGKSEREESRS
eukprot:6179805-Pleurochrysis_carterae.AAC.1